MKILKVKASKKYNVVITDNFDKLNEYVSNVFKGKRLLVICDDNTEKYYFEEVKNTLKNYEIHKFSIESGEQSKCAENYLKALSYLAENKFTRVDGVVALGGGVVGDLSGFVSASYMRGISYVQVPTTLLSFVDSSVGGKTAINLKEGKNLVGAFYQPSLCYINLSTLKTLPKDEMLCGYGEIVKYAYLSKTVSLNLMKNGSLEDLVLASLKIKANIVKKDEYEASSRALLNLGHTIGHTIEALSNFKIPHGVCVAKGISKIIEISKKYYGFSNETEKKLLEILDCYPFDLSIEYSKEDIAEKILSDKKVKNGYVNFVLIKDKGNVNVEKISIEEIKGLL